MKNFIIIISLSFILFACNDENPITFSKITDKSTVTLQLDTNKTFIYTANSKVGAAFNEIGTFKIEDSLLILQFENKEYSYGCVTVPLPNDTLLFIKFNNKYVLHPLLNDIPQNNIHISRDQMMKNICAAYTSDIFADLVGKRFFMESKGNVELLYSSKYKISKHYDNFIK